MASRSPTGKRVFVTNLGYHDYTEARRLGDIVAITTGRVNIKNSDRLQAEIQDILDEHKFAPTDLLLISGNGIIASFVLGYWLEVHGTPVTLVYWDPLLRQYHVREEDFTRKEAKV
jgi:hypothetical protein